jgi:hypothetical protein
MNFELHPISAPEKLSLETWLTSKESHLFRDLVTEAMEAEYLEAIKVQIQKSDDEREKTKFTNQAAQHIKTGENIHLFLTLLSKFSSPDHQFKRLKHK